MTAVVARSFKRAAVGTALRLPRSWVAAAVRVKRPELRRVTPVGWFERDDGSRLPVLAGYRDYGKGAWRRYWWATQALLVLDERDVLPGEARELVDALRAAATLPAPVSEFAARATAIAAAFPSLLRPTGRADERLGTPIVAPVPSQDDIRVLARLYAAGARPLAAALEWAGVDLAHARLLEAGCGHGYTASALVAAGAGEVVGVDLDVQGVALPEEIDAVRAVLAGDRPVRLDTGDLRDLAYPDADFDAVVSVAVLEHVDDVPRAFSELARVTKPGGIGYHGIDQWFGAGGGHSLCTLDAPWGHVRVNEDEIERYLLERRPNEAADALEMYRHRFQRPRLTLRQTSDAARAAGFEVLSAKHTRAPLWDPHRAWFSAEVMRDCRRHHPAVEARDLLSVSTTLVLRRRR